MSGRRLLGMLALANPQADYSRHDLRAAQKLARAYAVVLKHQLAEAKQREEDEKFRAIISSSKDIIFTVDFSGMITYVSPRILDYGFTPGEIVGRPVDYFTHPDDKEFIRKAFENAIRTGRTMPILPYRSRRKDGSYFHAEQKSSVVSINGKPSYITGVIRDMSEQKKIELRLKESEALMRMVFETAKDAIFIKDMNGMYIKVNRTCADWMGTVPEQMIGRTDCDYMPGETAGQIFKSDSEVARTGKTLSLFNFHPFPAGARHVNIIKTPLRNVRGETIGLLGIARDISELKKMEAELATIRAAEVVSSVARPMAHDFNNALAAINGYATLIDDDLAASSPIKNEISLIIQAVKRAAELTSKFQDFARDPKLGGQADGK
jgi:PAS domain S-box-containing protein